MMNYLSGPSIDYSSHLELVKGAIEDFYDFSMSDMGLLYSDLKDTLWSGWNYWAAVFKGFLEHPDKLSIQKLNLLKAIWNRDKLSVEERTDGATNIFLGTPENVLDLVGSYLSEKIDPYADALIKSMYDIQKFIMSYDIRHFAMPTIDSFRPYGVDSYLVNEIELDENGNTTRNLKSVNEGLEGFPDIPLKHPDTKAMGLKYRMDIDDIPPEQLCILNDYDIGERAIDKLGKRGAIIIKSDDLPKAFKTIDDRIKDPDF